MVKPGSTNLGQIRGGHAICVKPGPITDPLSWYHFYDQGQTGECVGFSWSRCMSLFNRVRYDAPAFYMVVTENDEFPDTQDDPNSGTSVRAGGNVLKSKGHIRHSTEQWNINDGITEFRWATSADEVLATIMSPLANRLEAVPLLQSWGDGYPHIAWLPLDVLQRLLNEQGEAAIPTDIR